MTWLPGLESPKGQSLTCFLLAGRSPMPGALARSATPPLLTVRQDELLGTIRRGSVWKLTRALFPPADADRVCTRATLLLKRDDDDSSTVISSHSGASEEKIRGQQLAEYSSRLKVGLSSSVVNRCPC